MIQTLSEAQYAREIVNGDQRRWEFASVDAPTCLNVRIISIHKVGMEVLTN